MKPIFDWYAFADYSGARSPSGQRKHIAWAVDQGSGTGVTAGITREGLLEAALFLLREAQREGKRMLFGFDHNYGFPQGFYEAAFGEAPADWREVLEGFAASAGRFMALKRSGNKPGVQPGSGGGTGAGEKEGPGLWNKWLPRDWAREMNERIAETLGRPAGPFWGTLFARRPDASLFGEYMLPSGERFLLADRRLAEERFRRLKPAYQIGGIGSVGQQSLYGMLYLRELLRLCREEGIPVHVWPQDGMRIPADCHVAVEIYPTLSLLMEGIGGPRTDAGDAAACVQWTRRMDREGRLEGVLRQDFTPEEWGRVRLEGWVLGVTHGLKIDR